MPKDFVVSAVRSAGKALSDGVVAVRRRGQADSVLDVVAANTEVAAPAAAAPQEPAAPEAKKRAPAARKTSAKKAPAKKAPATKAAAAKKAPAKKAPAKKGAAAKKAPAKKASATKAPVSKAPAAGTSAAPAAPPAADAPVASAPALPPALAAESAWTQAELDAARRELTVERERLLTEITASEATMVDLARGAGDGSGDDQADQGSRTFEREQEMSLAAKARDIVDQIDLAMRRMDEGRYGICENCGQPIGKARLQAFPRATLCLRCKQREERR